MKNVLVLSLAAEMCERAVVFERACWVGGCGV